MAHAGDSLSPSTEPTAAAASSLDGESAARVFAVELLTQKILSSLDAPSVVQFATFLRSREAWRHVLSDETLWRELLVAHFGGPVPAHVPAATTAQRDAYLGEGDFSDDEDDEDIDSDLGDGDDEDDASDSDSDARRRRTTRRTRPPASAAATAASTTTMATTSPAVELPVPRFACQSFVHFVRSSHQRERFRDAVHVLSGDIGTIVLVAGARVDAIAFATSGYLRNPHSGVASVVYERAGRGLDHHVDALNQHIEPGEVFVTPGFDAGVAKLIHCAGPIYLGGRGIPILAQTYDNVLRAAVREDLHCVAMTSISTGNLGFPLREAAKTGLVAIQRFVREHAWSGTLAVVCYEPEVFDEFTRQRQRILDAFNAV